MTDRDKSELKVVGAEEASANGTPEEPIAEVVVPVNEIIELIKIARVEVAQATAKIRHFESELEKQKFRLAVNSGKIESLHLFLPEKEGLE